MLCQYKFLTKRIYKFKIQLRFCTSDNNDDNKTKKSRFIFHSNSKIDVHGKIEKKREGFLSPNKNGKMENFLKKFAEKKKKNKTNKKTIDNYESLCHDTQKLMKSTQKMFNFEQNEYLEKNSS